MKRNFEDQRAAAYELYLQGLKYQEIADAVGVTVSAVKSWATRYWKKEKSQPNRKKAASSVKDATETKKSQPDTEKLFDNKELSEKQQLFCIYYSRTFNATKSYQKAYDCSYKVAMSSGCRLLGNEKIKAEIHRLKAERVAKEMLTQEDIFQKYMDIAFNDITDYIEFGTEEVPVMSAFGPIEVKDADTGEKVPLMKTVNVVRFKNSDEIDGTLISEVKTGRDGATIKIADRMKALEWLSDHLDMLSKEQRAKVDLLRAQTSKINALNGSGEEEVEDDGFLEALNGTAKDDWDEEESQI